MSAHAKATAAAPTRTAPARVPDGWWTGHTRYRNYVMFAGSGMLLWVGALLLLEGLFALAAGVAAWEAYLAALRSPLGVGLVVLVLVAAVFFSQRFLRVGVKVAAVDIGPMPAMPGPVVFVLHFAGLGALTGLVLLVAAGVVL